MKKNNFWIAVIACVMIFFGSYFKVQHWPGAGPLIIVGGSIGAIFALLYMFSNLKDLSEGKEKINGIIGGITMILVLIGFIFKTLHWPGANVLVYVGHAALLIYGISLLIDAFGESDENKKAIKVFTAFTIFMLMSILVMLGLGSITG